MFVYFIQSGDGPIKIGKTGDLARRVTGLRTGSPDRTTGNGNCEDGTGCVEDWRTYLLGGPPDSDTPPDECPVVRAFKIALNDDWPDTERDRLKKYGDPRVTPATRSTHAIETRRALMALDWTMRVHRPLWLDAAGMGEHAARLRGLPEIIDEATFAPAAKLQEEVIQAAWEARAAWAAWAAIPCLVAKLAGDALPAAASDEDRKQAGIVALNAVAAKVRDAELDLLDRMIAVRAV